MPIEVEIDGTVHEFPDDFTDADIAAALGGGAPKSTDIGLGDSAMRGAWMDNLPSAATSVASMALPGVIGGAVAKVAPTAARLAASPLGGAAIGAMTGGMTGGTTGAVLGGIAGYNGGGKFVSALRRLLGGSDEVAAGMSQAGKVAPPVSAPSVASPTKAGLEKALSDRIDWRLTDAVPIDAIKRDITRKGGSIIEAGESQIGLAEAAAQAQKQGDLTEVERLLRALRQRGHVQSRAGGSR